MKKQISLILVVLSFFFTFPILLNTSEANTFDYRYYVDKFRTAKTINELHQYLNKMFKNISNSHDKTRLLNFYKIRRDVLSKLTNTNNKGKPSVVAPNGDILIRQIDNLDSAFVLFSAMGMGYDDEFYCRYEIYPMEYRHKTNYTINGEAHAGDSFYGGSISSRETLVEKEHFGTYWEDYDLYRNGSQRYRTIEKFTDGNSNWYQDWYVDKSYCSYRVDECILGNSCGSEYGLNVYSDTGYLKKDIVP